MTYTQINKAVWENGSDVQTLAISDEELRAWKAIEVLEGIGGFDEFWDACAEADEQNQIFKALAKVLR